MTEESFLQIFSRRLRYYMSIHDISQKELAEQLGVGTTSVYNWCNGIKSPRMDKVDRMCKIFGCRLSDLMESAPAAAPLQLTPLEEKIITRYRISPATIQGAVCDILHVSQEDADNAQYSESNNTNAG